MKVTTIALATAFTPTSTFALAQTTGTEGYGSVVAPSVAPASPRLERSAHVEEHRPAASLPSSTVGSASRNTGASIGQARNGFRAPEVKLLTYLRGPALTFSKASFPGCRTRVQQADSLPSVQHGMTRVRQDRSVVTYLDQAQFRELSQIAFTDGR